MVCVRRKGTTSGTLSCRPLRDMGWVGCAFGNKVMGVGAAAVDKLRQKRDIQANAAAAGELAPGRRQCDGI